MISVSTFFLFKQIPKCSGVTEIVEDWLVYCRGRRKKVLVEEGLGKRGYRRVRMSKRGCRKNGVGLEGVGWRAFSTPSNPATLNQQPL